MCPHCGSTRSQRYRSPVERNEVVLRRHRCGDCHGIFVTAQVVVVDELAEQLIPLLDEAQ